MQGTLFLVIKLITHLCKMLKSGWSRCLGSDWLEQEGHQLLNLLLGEV